MISKWLCNRLSALILAAAIIVSAPAVSQEPLAVNAQDRAAIVDDVAATLREGYVFPDVGVRMAEHVRQQLASGAYDRLGTLEAFTQKLTEDLQSVSHDLHLRVGWHPAPPPRESGGPTAEEIEAQIAARMRRDNYCFRKVERLAGNVGYLKLDCFAPAEPGGATAVATMGFLAGSDALIFDLRDNDGGERGMVQLITSYLVPAETHLDSFYVREGDRTEQTWTQAWVPGTPMRSVPLFLLTSSRTFSAAEEFSYVLKHLKRATLVGETTAGGANMVGIYLVEGFPVAMSVPTRRPVHPVTGTNWEGTGVEPDVAAPAPEALAVAHERALTTLAEKATDPARKAEMEFVRGVLQDRRKPVSLSAAQLQAYAGTYDGPRTVTLEGGALWYQREGGPRSRLLPVGPDSFVAMDRDDLRLRFERDASGNVVRLVGLFATGGVEPHDRSGE